MVNRKNESALKGLSADERAAIERAVEGARKRAAYQKVRNARPEVRAARTAYNRKRYSRNKALLARAKELGLIETGRTPRT
jgi:hypothetical protein